MSKTTKEDVLRIVTTFYLESRDFNGIPSWTLSEKLNQDWSLLKAIVRELIKDEMVGLVDAKTSGNPHIKRFPFQPKDVQISKLNGELLSQTCIYPTPKHLYSVVKPKDYEGEPYKLCLALGEAQLRYRSFNLSVLEFYRNEPRYIYENDDIQGHIYYDTEKMSDSDKVLLETFGFSYDDNDNRAVAVFLRYLADLTPEHQRIWKTKELQGDYKLHPAYYNSTIIGSWGSERIPICSALLKEIFIINQMSKAMGRPPLFKEDFGEDQEKRPKKFGLLIRPTFEEFNNFIHLLDKMLSDNINLDFFKKEVSYVNKTERKDGKIQVQQKGTLQILDNWTHTYFISDNWDLWEESYATLLKIRKMRQKPAHSINKDRFDQKYFKKQRKIIKETYSAVRTIRIFFANDPRAKSANIEIPDCLQEEKIWTR